MVYKVNLLCSCCINLIIYRLENVQAYKLPMDVSGIPQLGRSVVLNRKANSYVTGENDKGDGGNSAVQNGPPPLISKDPTIPPMPKADLAPDPEIPLCIQPSRFTLPLTASHLVKMLPLTKHIQMTTISLHQYQPKLSTLHIVHLMMVPGTEKNWNYLKNWFDPPSTNIKGLVTDSCQSNFFTSKMDIEA